MKLRLLQVSLVGIFILLFLSAGAQSIGSIKELVVGDQCPDFTFPGVLNERGTQARLTDFKGKLVILDFWATSCLPCIAAMPKLDSLNAGFKEGLKIIPVTSQAGSTIQAFTNKNGILKKLHIPMITGDSVLRQYFPHLLIPHEVWIDGDGVVAAITDGEQITAENIRRLLENRQTPVSIKKDIMDFDPEKPLLIGGLGRNYRIDPEILRSSSVLTPYISGLPGMSGLVKVVGNHKKYISTNVMIETLYQSAYSTSNKPFQGLNRPESYLMFPSRTIWEAHDSTLYFWHGRSSESWKEVADSMKYFCYELILPRSESLELTDYVIQDLNRYFGNLYGIEAKKEKRSVKCWVLTRKGENMITYDTTVKKEFKIDKDSHTIHIQNYSLADFMFWWLSFHLYRSTVPVIDESGYTGMFNVDIKADPEDISSMSRALSKYGFELRLEQRELEMIIIEDVKVAVSK